MNNINSKRNTLETLNYLIEKLDKQIDVLSLEKDKIKSKIIWVDQHADVYKQLKIIDRDQLCTSEVNSFVVYHEIIPPTLETPMLETQNVGIRFYLIEDGVKIYCDPFNFSLGYIGLDYKFTPTKNWQLPCIKAGMNKKVLLGVEEDMESISSSVESYYRKIRNDIQIGIKDNV